MLTNDSKPTSDPDHVERLQQLFPPPSAAYDSPLQMSEDLPEHWPSEIEISDLWNTQDAFERILKFHSMPALTKYIRSRSLLCAPDIDGWRMKDLFQRGMGWVIALQKPSGGIRGISPVDIWRRATGHATERWSLIEQGRGFKSCSLVACIVSGVRRADCSSIRVFEAVAMAVFQGGHGFMS